MFKYSSLAAILSAAMAPIYYLFLSTSNGNFTWPWMSAILVIAIWLIYKHKGNIHKLIHGKESKIGSKKKAPPPSATTSTAHSKRKKRL